MEDRLEHHVGSLKEAKMEGIEIYDVTRDRVYGRFYKEVFCLPITVIDYVRVICKDRIYFMEKIKEAYSRYNDAWLDAIDILGSDIEDMTDTLLKEDLGKSVLKIKTERRTWITYKMMLVAVDWFAKNRPPIYKEKWLE